MFHYRKLNWNHIPVNDILGLKCSIIGLWVVYCCVLWKAVSNETMKKGFKCMKWAHITRYHRIYRKCFARAFLTASRRGQEQTRVSTAFHRVVRVRLVVMLLVIVNIFTVPLCKYIDIWHLFVFACNYMKNVIFVFLLGVFANQAAGQAKGKSSGDNQSDASA